MLIVSYPLLLQFDTVLFKIFKKNKYIKENKLSKFTDVSIIHLLNSVPIITNNIQFTPSFLYLLKMKNLYLFLNCVKLLLFLISSCSSFHKWTPLTEIHICFWLVRTNGCSRSSFVLRLYLPTSLSLNIFCRFLGSK